MSNLHEQALAYAEMGLPVLPLRPGAKEPASEHGKDDATTDVVQINEWWARNPNRNIGARPPEGYAVLDVDPRNGGDDELVKVLDGNRIPTTWRAKTGSGGWHIWLKAPGKLKGRLCKGVDIKHHSGYLVMPPSIHPCGDIYEWVDDSPVAYAPMWLLQMMRQPDARIQATTRAKFSGNTDGLVRAVANAIPHNKDGRGRNDMLYWAARQAIKEGTFTAIRDDLESAARNLGSTELEINRTINSAIRGERA